MKTNKRNLLITTILTMVLSGCGMNKEEPSRRNSIADKYIDFFSSPDYEYKNPEIFPSDVESLDIINQKTTKECPYIFDKDIDKLLKNIEENTMNYLKEHPQYYNMLDLDNKENDLYKTTFTKALKKAITNIYEKSSNDIDEDMCKINQLVILAGNDSFITESSNFSSTVLGYYQDNCIIINYQELITRIDNQVKINKKVDDNFLVLLLEHELNHARQTLCSHRINLKDKDIKQTTSQFLKEASAESELYNLDKDEEKRKNTYAYSYQEIRKYESLMLLLALGNDKVTLDDYYNAIFDSDKDRLYDFFKLDTKKEKLDFEKVTNTFDTALGYSQIPYEYYNRNSFSIKELTELTGQDHKIKVFNMALTNMVEYTKEHKDFSLEQNLLLLEIIHNTVLNTGYNDYDTKTHKETYEEDFSKKLIDTNNKYIEFLSEFYNKDTKEIKKIMTSDSHNNKLWLMYTLSEDSNFYTENQEKEYKEVKALRDKFPVLEAIAYTGSYNDITKWNNFEKNSYQYQKAKCFSLKK